MSQRVPSQQVRPGEPETALRRRTRRAIIDAAVHLWARDYATPLSAIAESAGVSRSTLHRYFPDRRALVDGCLAAVDEVFAEGWRCAADSHGSALEQLIAELDLMLPLGDWVLFLWSDPTRFADHPLSEEVFGEEGMESTRLLIERGQAAGELDPEAPTDWLHSVYYAILYSAAESVVNARLSIPEASRLAARALRRGITG